MKIIKTLWRILNIVHQVRKKSSCSTSRRSLRRLRCSQQVRTGTGIIHGWRGSHWSEEFYDISEIQKFDWKNVFSLALTCLQSACLSNEHAPPARKFQKQTQRYMKMPENLTLKKWLFLTLFGKCCSIRYKTSNVTNYEMFCQNVLQRLIIKVTFKITDIFFRNLWLTIVLQYLEYNVSAEIETFTSRSTNESW